MKSANGWNLSQPVGTVSGTDWVVTDLAPGRDYEFIVRAKNASGEDQNQKVLKGRPTSDYPTEEWRAVWASRYDWARGNKSTMSQRIREMMETLSRANFNAIVFQVRGQGDTLYPSRDEPWSHMIKGDARTFDPVKLAIEEAHKNNIQLHAWLNLSVIYASSAKTPPTDKNHPFYLFADTTSPERSRGVIHDANGRPKVWGADNYVWLSHGNPEVNSYVRRQVMNFLESYPVDGLHWDDRTGNPNGVSFDPVSKQRFNGRGNPHKIKDMGKWQRDQLSRFLMNIYVEAKAQKPTLLIMGSPFGIADRDRIDGYRYFSDTERFGVEPESWLKFGVLDAITPQIYWNLPDPEPNYPTLVRDWIEHNKTGRPIWPGSAVGKYGDTQEPDPWQIRYVAVSRAYGLNGNTIFHYNGAEPNEWIAAAKKMYPNKASVPIPNHMRPLRTGQIMGWVTDARNRGVVDCWVAVKGNSYIYTTSADGFFGIANVPPGKHQVMFSTKEDELITRDVVVEAGKTAEIKITVP